MQQIKLPRRPSHIVSDERAPSMGVMPPVLGKT